MGILNDLARKVNARGKQIKGDYQRKSGSPLKGRLLKFEGKLEEFFADLKLRSRNKSI